MPRYRTPDVFVEETGPLPPPIAGVPTGVAALIGRTGRGPKRPTAVTGQADYERKFGTAGPFLPAAVRGFFGNGGQRAYICRLTAANTLDRCLTGLESGPAEEVAIVAAPGLTDAGTAAALIAHCRKNRRFAVLDLARDDQITLDPREAHPSADAACYVPWLETAEGFVPPSGHVLGIYARTDEQRGVWKAPANEVVQGATGLEHALDEQAQELLGPRGINLVRSLPGRGIRIWGARTLSADPEWKYVNVRRLFLFLERSIDKGTQWAMFEPNDAPLWRRLRGSVENFLTGLWRAGALAGVKPEQAFYVRCDRTTMSQSEIDNGRLIVEIGIAPARPAEFVVFRIGQWTADAG